MRIVCLGDSNTKGLDPRSFIYEEYEYPWPRLLEKRLNQTVINEGEHGQCVYSMKEEYEYLDSILRADDMIVLMLGTNDLLKDRNLSLIEQRLDQLVNYLQAYSCLLICPVDVKGKSLVEVYQSVSKKYQIPFLNANMWNIQISYDEVHFTQEGHESIAKELAQYLKTVFMNL
ncbi:MAG: hypothetical protein KBT48_03575 [Firmicutes bacterium]|nr:hypothetical protein [Bacillota bacterium]